MNITVNVPDPPYFQKVLRRIKKLERNIMAKLEDFQAALSKVDSATTAAANAIVVVGDRIKALEDRIRNAGLDQSQEEQILNTLTTSADNLQAVADALTQMGQSPANPVPTPVPTVDPVPPTPTEGTTPSDTNSGTGTENSGNDGGGFVVNG